MDSTWLIEWAEKLPWWGWALGSLAVLYLVAALVILFTVWGRIPKLPDGWKEKTRWATKTDGPVLAFHSQEGKTIVYLIRWSYLILFPLILSFLIIHERTHAQLQDPDDCPNVCLMYGNTNQKDSWSEKNPLIWFKVFIQRLRTGTWYCEQHKKEVVL